MGVRLPGRHCTPFSFGKTLSTEQANYDGNHPYDGDRPGTFRQTPLPVGSFPPNAWGLFDMHGNVWEWCSDWYERTYPEADRVDPQGPLQGDWRAMRGGSWRSTAAFCRAAFRDRAVPHHTSSNIGLRVVLSPS